MFQTDAVCASPRMHQGTGGHLTWRELEAGDRDIKVQQAKTKEHGEAYEQLCR